MARRLKRFDIYLTKNFSVTDTRQVVANGAVARVYKQGATANGSGSIAATLSGNITVRHAGRIAVGDTLCVGTAINVTATVNTVTETAINVTAGASTFAWADKDRIVVLSNRPSTYVESTGNVGTPSSSEATADSLGHAFFYAEEESADVLYSTDGFVTTTPLYDQDGVGGNVYLSNERDSASAIGFLFQLQNALTTSGAKGFQIKKSDGTNLFYVDKDGNVSFSGDVPANSVPTAAIEDDAVTAAKIAADAVGSSEIAAGAVGTSELAADAVTLAKIAAGAIVGLQIGTGTTDFTLASATFTLITGCSLTITPDSSASYFLLIGVANTKNTSANSSVPQLRIRNTSDSVTYHQSEGDADGNNEFDNLVCVALVTGLSAAKTIELQAAEAGGGNGTPVIHSSTTDRKAKLIAIQFKKP